MAVLKNVYMYYAKIKNPALEYQKEAVQGKPHMNRVCVVDVLVPENVYKALKKKYKGVKAVKDAREFDAKEFEEAFKVAPPYEADTYYVVKFKKKTYYKDGNEAQKPKVVGQVGQTKDINGKEISVDVDLGNGTLGHVQFKERTWDNQFGKGMALDMTAVCIKELVEYVSQGSLEFEFDEDEDDEFGEGSSGFGEDGDDEAPFDADEPTAEATDNGDDDW